MKNFIAIILISFLGSCSSRKEEPLAFIQRFNNKDLGILLNVSIEARNERNDSLHYYYSHTKIENETLTIPAFECFDNFYKSDSSTYNKTFIKLLKFKGVNENSPFNYAKEYAKKLDKIYRELGVIDLESTPKLGRFIEFTLDERCKVYYLEDSSTLTPYWKDKFSKLQKVDDKWFYECK
ncbi:hypothetical protein [Dyadobacter tibetensis]|uniref:hypothetical protein n=1 Tax=Dyadobacter tibetensis TaxID=1211851 RepID=UPI00046EBC6B|nr:hypothetical protein [Dyadobacter tibetensis]